MSSVNNSDEVKKLREYYKDREKALKAKQAEEKKQLAASHQANLEKISQKNAESMNDNRQDLKATITKNDMRHSADVERLKNLHVKQIKDQAERQNREEFLLRQSYEENLNRLQKKHQSQIAEKDGKNLQMEQNHQQEMRGVIEDYGRKHSEKSEQMKKKFETDFTTKEKNLTESHNKEREQMVQKHASYKSSKEGEVHRLKADAKSEVDRIQRTYQNAMAQQEGDHQFVTDEMRELHIDGVNKERRQYEKSLRDERERLQQAYTEMKDRGEGGKKIAELNKKVADLEKQNLRLQQKADRAKKREIENVRMTYEDNIENLQGQLQKTVKGSQQSKNENILELQQKADEQVKQAHEYFQSKLEAEADHNDRNVTRLEKRLRKENAQKKLLEEERFQRLLSGHARERDQLKAHQNKSLADLQREHGRVLSAERNQQEAEKRVMQESYELQVAKMQNQHRDEIRQLKEQQEALVAQMRSEFEGHTDQLQKQLIADSMEKEKTRDQDIKAKEAQFEYRLKKMEDAYNDSLKRMNTKHEESPRVQGKEGRGRYA